MATPQELAELQQLIKIFNLAVEETARDLPMEERAKQALALLPKDIVLSIHGWSQTLANISSEAYWKMVT